MTCTATLCTGTVPIAPCVGAVVGVPVDDEVRSMHADGAREPARAEERPDRLGLADDRLRDRRVVEEHDALVTAGDRLEALFEGLDLERRLVVDPAQRRLAEVRDLGTLEPADEALRAHDADLDLAELEDDVPAVEHDDVSRTQRLLDLGRTSRVVVVVPEHRDDRNGDAGARVRENLGLLGKAVGREITCK